MDMLSPTAQTPMLKQYLSIKAQHTDTILFFRLGDFYEMFYEDAVEASKILEIALTSRNKGEPEPVPLCGIPYHSCQSYIAKLLAAGKKVAICEQVEDPKMAKGVVKREVVRIVTPGMVFEDIVLEANKPNYLLSLYGNGQPDFSFSYIDISTAEFRLGSVNTLEDLFDELGKLDPKEILIPKSWEENRWKNLLQRHLPTALFSTLAETEFNPSVVDIFPGVEDIRKHFQTALKAAGALWNYVCYTQKGKPPHVRTLLPHETKEYLILDEAAQKNLELLETQDGEKKGGVLHLLDETVTAMGGRKLRQWLLYPLINAADIRERQRAIQQILDQYALQDGLEKGLSQISDLERLVGRIAMESANARDLRALTRSLATFPSLITLLREKKGILSSGLASLDGFEPLLQKIEKTLVEEPPLTLKEGGLIQKGVVAELDELREIRGSGKNYIASLELKERQATGISSLKIKYNRVFGYYIDVTHTHREKVPPHYLRKQTLVNSERYITPELKNYEEKVLGAEERIHQMEYELFLELRKEVATWGDRIQKAAHYLATLDALLSLAKVAARERWVCPKIIKEDEIFIEEGRHPIVEKFSSERFVPNDIHLDTQENRFLIITGPNMAGKSTVMRQVAIIVILAQIGSFVPASKVSLGVCDRIFTRVGASDRLARGESTFMVEMLEAAHILKEATPKSLVIIDEIGRGTSTYDGVAIAWAVAEYLHQQNKPKTLFATHYHELIDLPRQCRGMKNFNIAVKEWNDQIVFLRKLVPGGTSRSYGVEVAKLAGLPKEVIGRAREILAKWEEFAAQRDENLSHQLSLFRAPHPEKSKIDPIRQEIEKLDIDQMTPLQALEFLAFLKSKAGSQTS